VQIMAVPQRAVVLDGTMEDFFAGWLGGGGIDREHMRAALGAAGLGSAKWATDMQQHSHQE
jgi:hypothetical protein